MKCLLGDAWVLRDALIDWLRLHSDPGKKKAIVVPSAAAANYVREIGLQYPQAFMFCEVLTLPTLRSKLLQNENKKTLLSREDLALKWASLFPEHALEADGVLSEWIQLRRFGFFEGYFKSSYDKLLNVYENKLNHLQLRTLPQLDAALIKMMTPLWDTACFFGFSAHHLDDTLLLRAWMRVAKTVDFYALYTGESTLARYGTQFFFDKDIQPQLTRPSQQSVCQFYCAQTIVDEAVVIVRQAIRYLNEGAKCVDVALAVSGPLYTCVVAELSDRGVVFYDGILSKKTHNRAQNAFAAWLKWQNNSSYFYSFFCTLKNLGFLSNEIDDLKFKKLYQKAASEALTLDDAVVRNMMDNSEMLAVWTQWPLLPNEGNVDIYGSYVDKILEYLNDELLRSKWYERRPLLKKLMQDATFEKKVFLKWLEGLLSGPNVAHPKSAATSAAVRILSLVDALLCETDVLIMGGLNMTHRGNEYRYVDRVKMAGQYLPNITDEDFLLNDTYSLLSRRAHVILTYSTQAPIDGSRYEVLPWLKEFYFRTTGHLLDDLPTLIYKKENITDSSRLQPFDAFHRRRRDANIPSTDFCYSPQKPLNLSCKAWEEALHQPAVAWFKYIFKSQPQEFSLLPKAQMGTWSHTLVALNGENLTAIPETDNWVQHVEKEAAQVFQRVSAAYASVQRTVSHFWQMSFNEARQNAHAFVNTLKLAQGDCTHMWSEYSVKNIAVQEPFFEGILTGRIDVAFLKNTSNRDFIWIIDLKTGNDLLLSEKRLAKGEGLQLLLYGLAMQHLGYKSIKLSIAKTNLALKYQTQLNHVDTLGPWTLLKDFQSGRWGNNGNMCSKYAAGDTFPIATLAIDPQILEAQWNLTHPCTQI